MESAGLTLSPVLSVSPTWAPLELHLITGRGEHGSGGWGPDAPLTYGVSAVTLPPRPSCKPTTRPSLSPRVFSIKGLHPSTLDVDCMQLVQGTELLCGSLGWASQL